MHASRCVDVLVFDVSGAAEVHSLPAGSFCIFKAIPAAAEEKWIMLNLDPCDSTISPLLEALPDGCEQLSVK